MARLILIGALTVAATAALGGSIGASSGQEPTPTPTLHRQDLDFGAMGTEVIITALHADAEVARRALLAAREEFERIEDLMTSWRDSPLKHMNTGADGTPRRVPAELAKLVERSLVISRLSGGAFDPTIGAVLRQWDFKADPPVIPDQAKLEQALRHVDWEKVVVDVDASTVSMPAGTRVVLGGIAKGYGVDRAMAAMMAEGIENGLVNAGGDLKALGRNGDAAWTIAIKHPRDRERAIAAVPVSNVCLVTSGDYERFFEVDGKRYHHILDPRTGRPATGCMSATVMAPDAAVADAVATAVCVLGPNLGLKLVARLPRVEAIVVDMEGQVLTSEGLEGVARH
ncbi:FAD:protein FMN transferase [Planctomycetota bacterium]|nr:FAD:protein FMN transferase [Planctomycetota bacterium]